MDAQRHTFWTEQYLVQAFLCFNDDFEIVWSAGIMEAEVPTELAKRFPDYHRAQAVCGWRKPHP